MVLQGTELSVSITGILKYRGIELDVLVVYIYFQQKFLESSGDVGVMSWKPS